MIKQAMTIGCVKMDEAVATELIETLGTRARKQGKWKYIKNRLVPESRTYDGAWFEK